MSIKRYDIGGYDWECNEDPEGDWVRYEDIPDPEELRCILQLIDAFDGVVDPLRSWTSGEVRAARVATSRLQDFLGES